MIRTRFQGTYDDYLLHQAAKASRPKMLAKFTAERAERVAWFRSRFEALNLMPGTAMCLGARYGEEVEALRSLGWVANGIDLSEFPPWVERGDMNQPLLERYDLIYTNAFDHCWEPKAFARNIIEALNRGGSFMLHISTRQPKHFETVEWDSVKDVAALFPNATASAMPEFYGLDTEIAGVVR